jgi:homoserine dehydrogenase
MSKNKVKIGLVGFGVVGSGVAKILLENANSVEKKTGIHLELSRIVDLDTTSKRPVDVPKEMLTDDLDALLNDDSIQIVAELVGGTTIAKDIQLKILRAGKHVVTANKALLAKYGNELYAEAKKNDKCIAFEASCCGGIPIVSAIRTGLAANNINAIYGIVNGTCNYILSSMTSNNEDFAVALKQAQEKGYAEADPTLDINGGDSAHKLVILAAMAFGYDISLDDVFIEGIEDVSIDDIRYGKEMGYALKLLAIGERNNSGRISLRVHPAFISLSSPLASVDGPFNAVSIFGHAVGQTMYYGRGAGMMPTASAVVADIIEIAMGNSKALFNSQKTDPIGSALDSIDNLISRFYIRLMVTDTPGTFAMIGKILADHDISISGVLQHEAHDENNTVPAIITTHPNRQANVTKALADMEKLDAVQSKPFCIRIVDIPEDHIDD